MRTEITIDKDGRKTVTKKITADEFLIFVLVLLIGFVLGRLK